MTIIGRWATTVRVQLLALVVTGLVASACTTVETQSFVVRKSGKIESAQIATGADFSNYDRLQAEEMGIYFPSGVEMPTEDLERLRTTFRDAFLNELHDYSISRDPGPTTMAVQASLIDMRNASSGALASLRRDVRDMASAGSLIFLMELKDSETGQVLARAADSARAPTLGVGESATTDWQAVDEAARHWAALFREFLDQNLGQRTAGQ